MYHLPMRLGVTKRNLVIASEQCGSARAVPRCARSTPFQHPRFDRRSGYGGYAALQSQELDADLSKAVVAIPPATDLDRPREEFRDRANFLVMDNSIGNGPHVEAGSPARHAASFKAPVLMFHGDGDTNVNAAESRLMESRLKAAGKPVTYVGFRNLDHRLDNAEVRARMLSESDRFLRRTLGL